MAKHIRIISTSGYTGSDTSVLEESVNDGWEIISVVASSIPANGTLSYTLMKEDKVEED